MTLQADAKILIVDDEESLRLTFKMFLNREGYGHVVVASTYDEAMKAVEEARFDLIISDIVLEGASGTDLLRHIREVGQSCPVVMITGYPNVKSAAEAVRLGAFDYIPKPVNKETLLHVTRHALQQRYLEQEKQRLERENERYRHYLETIFRSVRDAIITVDTAMHIVEMNDMAKEWMSGMGATTDSGSPVTGIPGCMGETCFRDVQRVLSTRQQVREHRVECVKADGARRVLSLNAAPLDDGRGNFLGVVLVARDVTRLEDLEQRGRRSQFHRLIGRSPVMQNVYTLIENVGKVEATVLITGESGTGKELVAEALHEESPRRHRPLVKVDCTAISEELLESELFGHKKGSFTGADRDRMGRILQADGGTLFLDEIGDISPRMQLRLLRFLQEQTFYPVGRDQPIQVDIRLIAATNADLRDRVNRGEFREDLYFRLRVVDIRLPPLREREGDIALLVRHFIERFQEKMGREISGISDQALERLVQYSWPGNVRELQHVIERACVLCTGSTLTTEHFPEEIMRGEGLFREPRAISKDAVVSLPAVEPPMPAPVEDEKAQLLEALRRAGGNKSKAARLLGVDRSTLYRKLKLYNIELDTTKV